jgi:chemotaxis-related protein WspD
MVLLFRIGREWLAIDTSACREVADYQVPHRIPHRTGGQVMGLVNLRGTLHIIVDLAGLLHIQRESPGTGERMLLLEDRHATWGVLVEELGGVAPVSRDAVAPSPVAATASCIRGTVRLEGRVHGYLDEERLLAVFARCVE